MALPQIHFHRVLILDMNLIVTLFLGNQFTVNQSVVQHNIRLNHITLSAYLPDVKGDLDHIPLLLLLNL